MSLRLSVIYVMADSDSVEESLQRNETELNVIQSYPQDLVRVSASDIVVTSRQHCRGARQKMPQLATQQ